MLCLAIPLDVLQLQKGISLDVPLISRGLWGCSGAALERSGLLWRGMLLECWLLLLLLLLLLVLLLPSISSEFQRESRSVSFRFKKGFPLNVLWAQAMEYPWISKGIPFNFL